MRRWRDAELEGVEEGRARIVLFLGRLLVFQGGIVVDVGRLDEDAKTRGHEGETTKDTGSDMAVSLICEVEGDALDDDGRVGALFGREAFEDLRLVGDVVVEQDLGELGHNDEEISRFLLEGRGGLEVLEFLDDGRPDVLLSSVFETDRDDALPHLLEHFQVVEGPVGFVDVLADSDFGLGFCFVVDDGLDLLDDVLVVLKEFDLLFDLSEVLKDLRVDLLLCESHEITKRHAPHLFHFSSVLLRRREGFTGFVFD